MGGRHPLRMTAAEFAGGAAHEPGDAWAEVPASTADVAVSVHGDRAGETFTRVGHEGEIVLAFSGELYGGSPGDILDSYVRDGEASLGRLDGSYVICLQDGRSGATILATDYLGSRPLYFAACSGGIAFGPELSLFAGCIDGGIRINRDAAVTFLSHGHLLADQTWLDGVHAIPPGTVLRVESDGRTSSKSFFELGPTGSTGPDEGDEAYRRALAEHLRTAVARRFRGGQGLVLPLSGGIDSRGILGCLLELGANDLRTVTWGTEDQTVDSDAWVAGRLARRFGTEHTFLRRESSNLRGNVREMTRRIDATTDDPAMHPFELQTMRRIRDQLGGVRLMRGDECFGYGGAAFSDQEAFARVGLFQLSAAGDVQKLLHDDQLEAAIESSREVLSRIAAGCRPSDFTDRKDTYYATQRLRHYLNRSSYYKLTVMNLQNPWLDRQLLEFIWSVPTRYRVDKQLFTRTLDEMYPDLMAEPVASAHSLEDWGAEIRRGAELHDYLAERLVAGVDSLGAILDPARVSSFASGVLAGEQVRSRRGDSLAGFKNLARRLLPARAYSGLKSRLLEQGYQRPIQPAVLALRLLILSEWVERVAEFD